MLQDSRSFLISACHLFLNSGWEWVLSDCWWVSLVCLACQDSDYIYRGFGACSITQRPNRPRNRTKRKPGETCRVHFLIQRAVEKLEIWGGTGLWSHFGCLFPPSLLSEFNGFCFIFLQRFCWRVNVSWYQHLFSPQIMDRMTNVFQSSSHG